jgi:CRP/FNR family nitrogen fixation transcriptional regulator
MTAISQPIVETGHSLANLSSKLRSGGFHGLTGTLEMIGAPMSYVRNEEIFGEGEPAEYLYKVASGAVRVFKILDDGRRQISGFYLPGDFFGLEVANDHSASCEAICNATVLVMNRNSMTELAKRDSNVARKLLEVTASELARAQKHIMLLIRSAEERVGSFLTEIATRSHAAQEFDLPMSRQDIADHLGLTIETVSRTLTRFETVGFIELPKSRRVILRKRSALAHLSD